MDIRPIGSSTSVAEREASMATQAASGKKALAEPVQERAEVRQPGPAPSEEKVAQALKSINNVLQVRSQNLEFSVDSESDRTIVKVVDKNTQEVIRQMPTQEAMDIAKALDRLQSLLIRETA